MKKLNENLVGSSGRNNLEPSATSKLADSQAGTVIYRRNENGQTVIEGGTINPGFRFEMGQKSITLKPENVSISTETEGPKTKKAETPKSHDVRIAKRREKVRELSEKGEPVENIARLTGVSIPTVVRDRKFLGISTSRN